MVKQGKVRVGNPVRFCLLTLPLIIILALNVTPAWATDNGATADTVVTRYSNCFSFDDITACATYNVVTHTTLTPAGVVSYDTIATASSLVTDKTGQIIMQFSQSYRFHTLTRDEIEQEISYHFAQTIIFYNSGCTISFDYHLANGNVQFSRYSYICS